VSREKTTHDSAERRSRRRFRIGLDICYTCLSGTRTRGVGKVLDISSKGVQFTTECHLNPGTRIELSVNWPARLNDTCLLKLIVYGCVVRSEETVAAIRIECHEFRTRAIQTLPVLPDPLSYPKGI
jgi:PilZ domain